MSHHPDLYRCEECGSLIPVKPQPHNIASWNSVAEEWTTVPKRVCLFCCGEEPCVICFPPRDIWS